MAYVENLSTDRMISDANNFSYGAMKNDWDSYFKNSSLGSSIDWNGGKLTRDNNDFATFSNAAGQQAQLARNSYNFYDVAQQGGIGNLWKQQYGYNPAVDGNGIQTGTVNGNVLGAGRDFQGNEVGPYKSNYWEDQAKTWRDKLGLSGQQWNQNWNTKQYDPTSFGGSAAAMSGYPQGTRVGTNTGVGSSTANAGVGYQDGSYNNGLNNLFPRTQALYNNDRGTSSFDQQGNQTSVFGNQIGSF